MNHNINNRSLAEVFSGMKEELKAKAQNKFHEDKSDLECLCNNDENYLYLKAKEDGLSYAVCPKCNPQRMCTLCNGSGHRILDNTLLSQDGEREINIEKLSPHSCHCQSSRIICDLLNNAQIPEKYLTCRFDNIDVSHIKSEEMRHKLMKNKDDIKSFCAKIKSKQSIHKQDKFFITLYGPVGSSKTHLACAALKTLISKLAIKGLFMDFQFLLSSLRERYENKKSAEAFLKQILNTPILLIDEFGKARSENEWQLEKLDHIINTRYINNKLTIITTNFLPSTQKYAENEKPNYIKNLESEGTDVKESFWNTSLLERVGIRAYERILEVSEFIDFTGLPSYRRNVCRDFLEKYLQKYKKP